jgi:hypothetical protein
MAKQVDPLGSPTRYLTQHNLSFFNAGFHAGFFSNRASLKPGARA